MAHRLLLVEDNEVNRDMLERRLRFRGFEVECAVDGVDGIEKAKLSKPDLILMDMSLPKMNGWEATRHLKGNDETRAIPVIALTAHAMKEDRQEAMEAGCDGFHSKPIDMDTLIALIREHLPETK